MRYAGNLKEILKKEARERTKTRILFKEEKYVSEEEEEEEDTIQTFPRLSSMTVHRQVDGQLTCGMKCLQNMYGPHIVNREEMDSTSKDLETHSHGIQMYNPDLGFYAVEVLESVLQSKGKCVQRISLNKIPSEYYVPVIELNPTFSGYIVALEGYGIIKHYICIRYNGQYKKIDSMPGVQPCLIHENQLFKKNDSNEIICCLDETRPVVAVLAVGSTPFVEYTILHECWSKKISTPTEAKSLILDALNSKKQSIGRLQKSWFKKWQQRRCAITEDVLEWIKNYMEEQTQIDKNVMVHFNENQTVIRCKTMKQLREELHTMNWIDADKPFIFKQNNCQVYHSDMRIESAIDWSVPLYLYRDEHPQIGGFYTFNYSVAGTCTDKKKHAYSVRDGDGNTHVLYKKSIENIKQ